MNISFNWLKEYVNLDEDVTIDKVISALTMTGTKVEKMTEFGKRTSKVYTGIVKNITPHKEDSMLSVLDLDLESIGKYRAVAKIPDIQIGDIVPVALPGAKVIDKEVKVGEVKGIKSECMICHILDLGLNQKELPWTKPSGLISFPKDVKIGEDINNILGLGDYIIEFEITPNRPDCLSVEGVARELAATYNKPCKRLWQDKKYEYNRVEKVDNISVSIDTNNCKRYMLSVIDNVKVIPSPYEMQLKLIKSGVKPINNIVDITNYVMLEIGQPLHAFDYSKINGNICVKQADDNEKVVTLDDEERKLNKNNMVIADNGKAVAIAGVMGAKNSTVENDTTKIILEAASFVRGSVRNTAKQVGLRTDASSRYEKGLPQELLPHAVSRTLNLISEILRINVSNQIVDNYPNIQEEKKIKLDYGKICNIIGIEISKEKILKILNDIEIKVENDFAYIPYYREDLETIYDISEEVARLNGYDKISSTLPKTELTFGEKTYAQKMEDRVKNIVMSNGYSEIYTYTFFSLELLERMNIPRTNKLYNCVKIKNPLSQDFEYMRSTSLPLMLEALERNYTKKNEVVKIFELGRIFENADNVKENKLVDEKLMLTLGMYDLNKKLNYYNFKEVIDNILTYFGIYNLEYQIEREEDAIYHPGISAKILVNNEKILSFGKLSPLVAQNYILTENTYIAEIDFEKLIKYAKKEIKYVELPKYPAVERDISFITNKEILSFEIENKIKEINKDIIEDVRLFDVYEGENIEKGNKSVAYRVRLRSKEKTLEENDITKIMDDITKVIKEKLNGVFRK